MMKKFEIERLLRAYGRKSHDHVLESYLEFVRDFGAVDVRKAVTIAIDKSERLPVPADLRKLVIVEESLEPSECRFCADKGYFGVDGREYDQKGFRVIGHNLPVRCRCGATPPQMEKRFATQIEIRHWAIARLLAQVLAERATESEMIDDLEHWRKCWWHKEKINSWVTIAKRIGGLRTLVRITELIQGADPDDCAESPEKLCSRLLPTADDLKEENGIVTVFQGVRI